eukprot:780976-Karenia_brevis.AAC.1
MWVLLLSPLEDLVPGKTGQFDESIVLDSFVWMSDIYHILTHNQGPEGKLWPLTAQQIITAFAQACDALALGPLKPCRHALRHGG